MIKNFWLFLGFIILTILIVLGIYFAVRVNKANYDQKNNFRYGLCSTNEPYNKPKLVNNIITPAEAQEIIDWARPKLQEAEVITYSRKDKSHRNNKTTWLPKSHRLSKKIINIAAKHTNIPITHFEDIQISHYAPGNFFKYHQDQCYDTNEPCIKETARGGPRLYNILLYLNDQFTGGETEFPKLGKKYKLPPGDGILWEMLNKKQNQVHPFAEHAGLTVKTGEKWIANVWVRKDKFI